MAYTYDGFYARFESPSKKNAALLMGADTLVGDEFDFSFKQNGSTTVAWISNKFGAEIGFLDVESSRRLQLANARDLDIHLLLSYVAYSEEPDPGVYWGELAIICFDPSLKGSLDPFVQRVSSRMKEGMRPNIVLSEAELNRILTDPGWLPSSSAFVSPPEGSAVVKNNLSFTERLVEQGRSGNKGCYAGSIAFLVIVAAGLFFLLKGCIGF